MERCLFCGYPLKNPKSLACRIGGGCRTKVSSSKSRWMRKVERTCRLKNNEPIQISKTIWKKLDDNWIAEDGSTQPISNEKFVKFLKSTHLVLKNGEIDENLLEIVGRNLDDFINGKLDLEKYLKEKDNES